MEIAEKLEMTIQDIHETKSAPDALELMAKVSTAISLKRIADRLDRLHKSGLTIYDGNKI